MAHCMQKAMSIIAFIVFLTPFSIGTGDIFFPLCVLFRNIENEKTNKQDFLVIYNFQNNVSYSIVVFNFWFQADTYSSH